MPRIKWDLISRHWLHESSQEFMERRLSQELWPFEFLAETINVKMIDNMHCMALIDFKAFMFPGGILLLVLFWGLLNSNQ